MSAEQQIREETKNYQLKLKILLSEKKAEEFKARIEVLNVRVSMEEEKVKTMKAELA